MSLGGVYGQDRLLSEKLEAKWKGPRSYQASSLARNFLHDERRTVWLVPLPVRALALLPTVGDLGAGAGEDGRGLAVSADHGHNISTLGSEI